MKRYMVQSELVKKISILSEKNRFVLVAIDGRCGSGKTTLAERLKKELSASIVHLDDFFLRPQQRSKERLEEPGGNVDYERFYDEVLVSLLKNKDFSYRPYSCADGKLGEPVFVPKNKITIVEGSYSCHPKFWDSFDLHVFLDVPPDEQLRRIVARNGQDSIEAFKNRWIPLEEKYFAAFDIKNRCELVY